MKILNTYAKYLFLAFIAAIMTACGGGTCAPNSNTNPPIIKDLPNSGGAVVEIPVSNLSIPTGTDTTSTSVHLTGGTPGLLIGLSSTVTATPATNSTKISNQVTNSIPITVSFNPESLVAGTVINSDVLVQVTEKLSPGTYYINLYATYLVNGADQTILLGVMKIVVGDITPIPTPLVVPGTLSLSPSAGVNIVTESSASVTLSLDNSANVSNLVVNVSSANTVIATVSPSSCTLSTTANTCTLTVTGVSAGSTMLTASATNYTSATESVTVAKKISPLAYVIGLNAGQSILNECNLESATGALINCQQTITTMNNIKSVVFHQGDAYISNVAIDNSIDGDGNVYRCNMDADTSHIESDTCVASVTGTLPNWHGPRDVAFNTASNNTNYAYIATGGTWQAGPPDTINGIFKCNVNNDKSFSNCTFQSDSSLITLMGNRMGASYISFKTLNNIKYAYVIVQGDNPIPAQPIVCLLNSQGDLVNCNSTSSTLATNTGSQWMEFLTINGVDYVYVSTYNGGPQSGGGIILCNVNSVNGTFNNCNFLPSTGTEIAEPDGQFAFYSNNNNIYSYFSGWFSSSWDVGTAQYSLLNNTSLSYDSIYQSIEFSQFKGISIRQ